MKIWEIMETASAGGTSAGAIAAVANPGTAKKKKNKNGTVKNALDTNDNLMGGAAVKR
jgi:hypothetical protein